MFYLYILQDKISHRIYIGSTNNLKRRMNQHLKKNKSWVLVYYEAYQSEKDAREREQKLKHYGTSLADLKHRIKNSFLNKNGGGVK